MYEVLRWSRQLQLGDMCIAVPSGFWLLVSRAGVQWYVTYPVLQRLPTGAKRWAGRALDAGLARRRYPALGGIR